MNPTDQFVAVAVGPQTTEYNSVQQQFAATAQGGYSTVVKVNQHNYSALVRVLSIVINPSVCLCVCLSVRD